MTYTEANSTRVRLLESWPTF